MLQITLTFSTDYGVEEIALEGEKISLGRGGDVDKKIDDDGLSRLHATIFRENDEFWIVDENSTNGSFVNGEKVNPHGTLLFDGDTIKIGNYTEIVVKIAEAEEEKEEEKKEETTATNVPTGSAEAPVKTETKADAAKSSFGMIPLLITGLAVFVIAASAVFIGVKVLGSDTTTAPEISNQEFEDIKITKKDDKPKTTKTTVTDTSGDTTTGGGSTTNGGTTTPTATPKLPDNPNAGKVLVTENKKYQELSEEEKRQYISVKAESIAQIIGNQKSEPIPPAAISKIKEHLDGYTNRLKKATVDDCSQSGWMRSDFLSVLKRATKTSPFIVRNFERENVVPQVGIYVAMIESEHCECLTSKTGAVGMFQFLPRTAPDYGLSADDRCLPEPASKAAAIYLKTLIDSAGTGAESVPLAIAGYNSGQGAQRINLKEVLQAKGKESRSFWTMVENEDEMLSKYSTQFKKENVNYVPKFFAAAIIGENPQDFGVNQKPLSLYR